MKKKPKHSQPDQKKKKKRKKGKKHYKHFKSFNHKKTEWCEDPGRPRKGKKTRLINAGTRKNKKTRRGRTLTYYTSKQEENVPGQTKRNTVENNLPPERKRRSPQGEEKAKKGLSQRKGKGKRTERNVRHKQRQTKSKPTQIHRKFLCKKRHRRRGESTSPGGKSPVYLLWGQKRTKTQKQKQREFIKGGTKAIYRRKANCTHGTQKKPSIRGTPRLGGGEKE